jgi:hypothetical protein
MAKFLKDLLNDKKIYRTRNTHSKSPAFPFKKGADPSWLVWIIASLDAEPICALREVSADFIDSGGRNTAREECEDEADD